MTSRRRSRLRYFLAVGAPCALIGAVILFRAVYPRGIGVLEGFFFRRTAPLARAALTVEKTFRCAAYGACGDASPEEMTARAASYSFELERLREENAGLRDLLDLVKTQPQRVVVSVTLYGREAGKEFLILGEGESLGIAQGDSVVDGAMRVVGVVRDAGTNHAKVSIGSNAGEVFEVVLVPSGVKALARGLGGRTFSIDLIPQGTPVRKGDFVVILAGAVAARNIIAEITSFEPAGSGAFQNVRAVLVARPELMTEALVIKRFETAP